LARIRTPCVAQPGPSSVSPLTRPIHSPPHLPLCSSNYHPLFNLSVLLSLGTLPPPYSTSKLSFRQGSDCAPLHCKIPAFDFEYASWPLPPATRYSLSCQSQQSFAFDMPSSRTSHPIPLARPSPVTPLPAFSSWRSTHTRAALTNAWLPPKTEPRTEHGAVPWWASLQATKPRTALSFPFHLHAWLHPGPIPVTLPPTDRPLPPAPPRWNLCSPVASTVLGDDGNLVRSILIFCFRPLWTPPLPPPSQVPGSPFLHFSGWSVRPPAICPPLPHLWWQAGDRRPVPLMELPGSSLVCGANTLVKFVPPPFIPSNLGRTPGFARRVLCMLGATASSREAATLPIAVWTLSLWPSLFLGAHLFKRVAM